MVKRIILVLILVVLILGIGYVTWSFINGQKEDIALPVATITMGDGKIIKLELYTEKAPNTVKNFIKLANDGFYDGLDFHRTIPDFMIQGGDPSRDGTGGPDYEIQGEFSYNGFKLNDILHERGVISMARSDYGTGMENYSYNSIGSQFFIMTETTSSLDGAYSAFGRVIEGMEVVDEIANVEVITRDQEVKEGLDEPVEHPIITSIRVDTFGVTYGDPITQEPFDYYSYMYKQYEDLVNSGQYTVDEDGNLVPVTGAESETGE
jgi:Peptidyl-prolyl cis-trans isomerase (rotamase) - cyclophilin family